MSPSQLKLAGVAWILTAGVVLADTPFNDSKPGVLFELTPSAVIEPEEFVTADFESALDQAAASGADGESILPLSACILDHDHAGCRGDLQCGACVSDTCGSELAGCSLCGKERCHRKCWSKCGKHGWGIARHGCCKRHCLHSTCDMYPHYAYFPEHHGYYYFRPYNFMHVFQHQEQVLQLGGDSRNPYSVSMFAPLHREFDERVPRIHEPEERVRLQEVPLPQLEDLLN